MTTPNRPNVNLPRDSDGNYIVNDPPPITPVAIDPTKSISELNRDTLHLLQDQLIPLLHNTLLPALLNLDLSELNRRLSNIATRPLQDQILSELQQIRNNQSTNNNNNNNNSGDNTALTDEIRSLLRAMQTELDNRIMDEGTNIMGNTGTTVQRAEDAIIAAINRQSNTGSGNNNGNNGTFRGCCRDLNITSLPPLSNENRPDPEPLRIAFQKFFSGNFA